MQISDESLIHALAAGDDGALRTIMERHEGRVRGWLARRLPSYEDAEEAAQDVFLKVRRSAGTFNGTAAFRPWLGAIARNTLRDRLRRGRGEAVRPLVEEPLADLEVWEREHRAEEVRAALDSLPHRYRAALALHYFAGLGYREAAAELSLTPRGFETRLARARVRLRRALLARTEETDGLF